MAGVRFDVELNSLAAQDALNQLAGNLNDIKPALRDIGEYLLGIHMQRFSTQTAPDGTPWKPLSPRYALQKKKNKGKILTLDGYLGRTLHYQVNGSELVLGSNLPYAAIHQFGGEINVAERIRTVYFKRDKNGVVGNRFVKKKNSNFAQDTKAKAHKISMPARPFLGTSENNNMEVLTILIRHLDRE